MNYIKALKLIEKQENTWYCGTCKKFFVCGPYCFEKHFDKKHPKINWRAMPTYEQWKLFANHSWNRENVRQLVRKITRNP